MCCHTYPWSLSSVKCSQGEKSPWSLSLGICEVWPKLGEEIVVKDSTMCKVWMVQSFKMPSGARKGWEMLPLCWECREGSQSLLPWPPYVPGHWCRFDPSGTRAVVLPSCREGHVPSSSPAAHHLGVVFWAKPARSSALPVTLGLCPCLGNTYDQQERGCAAAQAFKSCHWCRGWGIESANCSLRKSRLIHFHIFGLFHLSCSLPNCSFSLPSLSPSPSLRKTNKYTHCEREERE